MEKSELRRLHSPEVNDATDTASSCPLFHLLGFLEQLMYKL